jgi:NAD(P)-dependent dehydrogenase (short-subunit alcohol dehydrogenase family)
MDLGLKGKIAIVTGGARGIGAGMCEVFAEEGAYVVIADMVPLEESGRLAEELGRKNKVRTLAVRGDISNPQDVKAIYGQVLEKFGTVDILMNNAGKMGLTRIEDVTVEELYKYEKVNIEGMFLMSKEFIIICNQQKKGGHIVNTISKSAFTTNSGGNSPYIATKGAVFSFTRGLAKEVGSRGIFVNGIVPGYVITDTTKDLKDRSEQMKKIIPLGREATPREIANVAVFLCSEKAVQMMGAIVDVSGGTML